MSDWSIDFAPMLPAPLYWLAVGATVLLIAVLFYRGTRGAMLRALALAALLFALANPTLRKEEKESLGNVAIVIIDESTSNAIEGRPEQSQAIRKALEQRLGAIEKLDVKWVRAARPTRGDRGGTHLFAALNRALADVAPDRLAGVIMVTDGQVHDVPKTAKALGFDAPIHTVLTGRPKEFDRRIEILKAPRYGIVGQKRTIELAVREAGNRPSGLDERVTLRVRREGEEDMTFPATIGETVAIPMSFPHAGKNIVEIDLAGVDGELTLANNRIVIVADGVRENLRVLLVSGKPHAGERTWRNLLKSDAAVDLVHFTILRPPHKQDGTPINQLSLIAFPTRELFSIKIKEFDLIIFDRYQHRGILQLLYYDNIARYVEEHGGALLVAAGDDYAGAQSIVRTPLINALPALPTGEVLQQPFRPKLTDLGTRHPVTRNLPGGDAKNPKWGRWFRQVEVRPERGRTVMTGVDGRPLLVLDRKGKGRVALLTSDHAWLWARGYDGGGPHTALLRRLSHWLMKEPDLEEERLIANADGLSLTVERRSLEKSVGPVTVFTPAGEKRELKLEPAGEGVWSATLEATERGLHKFETEGPNGKLTAVAIAGVADPREMSQVVATKQPMANLLQTIGGGQFWTKPEAGALTASSDPASVTVPRITMLTSARLYAGSSWLALKDQQAAITTGVSLTPMFNGFIALAAMLFLMTLAWWREGR